LHDSNKLYKVDNGIPTFEWVEHCTFTSFESLQVVSTEGDTKSKTCPQSQTLYKYDSLAMQMLQPPETKNKSRVVCLNPTVWLPEDSRYSPYCMNMAARRGGSAPLLIAQQEHPQQDATGGGGAARSEPYWKASPNSEIGQIQSEGLHFTVSLAKRDFAIICSGSLQSRKRSYGN
jgi:hypothetical protein